MARLSASGPHRSSLWRRLRPRENAATLLRGARACLALLAALAVLALAVPEQAEAQTDTTFISNSAQVGANASDAIRATAFTTGSNSGGYALSSVDVYTGDQSGTPTPLVEIYEDNAGSPGTVFATLGSPATVTDRSANTFTATNTTLSAGTTYWLVTSNSATASDATNPGKGFRVNTATNTTADTGAAMGWSIGNGRFKADLLATTWTSSSNRIIFAIKGTLGTAPTNAAPTVANPIDDQTATVGTALNYAFPANTFADTDAGDTLIYTATKSDDSALPSWLSFDAATRTFSGTPATADVGTVSVKVTASDGTDSVSDIFDIVVSLPADTTPPEVVRVAVPSSGTQVELDFDEDLDENVSGTLLVSVFSLTVDGQAVTIADYQFQDVTLFLYVPTGTSKIKQGQTVVLSYTDPTATDDTVALQDIAGNDVASFTTGMSGVPAVTNNSTVNNAPTVANLIPDQTAMAGTALNYAFPTNTFADTDAGDTLTYTATQSDNSALPSWLSFAAGTRTFSGTPATADVETVSVKVTASDGTDSVSDTFDIVVSAAANTPPTAVDNTVTTGEDMPYTFMAGDFGFDDTDTGDTLASVKIVTTPALGTLALDGTAVTADGVVTKAQIDGNMLVFTPARDAHGDPYTTFTFKVNDGTVDSASAYTMTIDVTDAPAPVCTAPSFGDRREIWTGTVTVGVNTGVLGNSIYGYDAGASTGALDVDEFTIGSMDYEIASLTSDGRFLIFRLSAGAHWRDDAIVDVLRLHVCDASYDFSDSHWTLDFSVDPAGQIVPSHDWTTSLDWSPPVVTRTVYLSLPANNAATGEPAISGTARAEQVLTADASPIMDTDGLTDVDFIYQWIRVDADGTSNPVDITDANAATYTLTDDDEGKKVKVKVSFTDELSGEEERTSAAYPSSGTVTAAGPNTAPTAANNTVTTGEDMAYAFMAGDFGFLDTDTGDTLASVKIVTTPALGALALDGTAVMADAVVTKTQIDGDMLTFRPAQDAHGAPYTTFTFKVNDGTDDSADAYTMTIDVTDAPAPVCAAPSFGDRREIWTGTVTVERGENRGLVYYGFSEGVAGTLLPSQSFSIGSNNYAIDAILVTTSGAMEFSLGGSDDLTRSEVAALRLNVCDGDYDFSTAPDPYELNTTVWFTTLDWSPPVVTRTVYLSLPANNAATGEPAITGTAQAGQALTAVTTGIMDADGLTGVDFTYQWMRVDADGLSNPADITDANAATYSLTAADVGKKIKVKVSFTDELSGEEERTSAAYPSSGTVIASANTTAPALTSVTVTSTPRKTTDTYGAREHIEFTMTFDAPVTVTGAPTFGFDLGGASTATWYAGSGTTTLRFSHAVTGGSSGDRDTNGISWAANAIELNGGTIAGTDNAVTAVLTHAAQSNLPGHKVDGRTTPVTPATVTDVDVTSMPTSLADTYGFGETIVITVTVSEAVEVEGDPGFRFNIGNPGSTGNVVEATYDRTRSTATTMAFVYTVQAGDMDTNGFWIGPHSQTFLLDANDRIRTASQQIDIDRSHSAQNTQSDHKVDGSLGAPTVPPDPTAPTLVSATATTLTVEWTQGDGGSPLTRNFVHYRVDGETVWNNWYVGETPVTRTVIGGLRANTAYDVRVHSANAIGSSSWVESATAFSTLANTAATGAPSITGTATVGEELTATTDTIADDDGLPSNFTYQWVRVDADGTSNPVDITDANAATYTLADDDAGKKIKVKVSFTDDLDSTETRTSAAFPSSGTVMGTGTNTAPFTAAWAADAYTADEGESVTVTATLHTAADEPKPSESYLIRVITEGNSATAVADYTPVATNLTVTPSAWTVDGAMFTATVAVTVETVEDSDFEGDERFYVILSGAVGEDQPGLECPDELRNLGGAAGCATVVTIADDETLSVTEVTVSSAPAADETYLAGEAIEFTVGFIASVTVTGTPTFAFTLGSAVRQATYASGSETAALVFSYTVLAGDLDRDGISWEADALALAGGTIRLTTDDGRREHHGGRDARARGRGRADHAPGGRGRAVAGLGDGGGHDTEAGLRRGARRGLGAGGERVYGGGDGRDHHDEPDGDGGGGRQDGDADAVRGAGRWRDGDGELHGADRNGRHAGAGRGGQRCADVQRPGGVGGRAAAPDGRHGRPRGSPGDTLRWPVGDGLRRLLDGRGGGRGVPRPRLPGRLRGRRRLAVRSGALRARQRLHPARRRELRGE